jgi:hypothetical protein
LDEREYELGIDLLWDLQGWTTTTEAWADADENSRILLRELPERTASDLAGCIGHLHAAVDDLMRFDDLVPNKAAG